MAGSDFAKAKMRRLAGALARPTASANCSQWRAWTSLKVYLLPIFMAIFAVNAG